MHGMRRTQRAATEQANDCLPMPDVEHIGPGLWSVPVPIPDNPLGYTLVYLLESDRGPVLVDAGWDNPTSRRALAAGLRAAGTAVEDVYGVLVTHHHFDHYGLADHVRQASGAWVALHPADADVLRRHSAAGTNRASRLARAVEVLELAGAPQDVIEAQRKRPAGMWKTPPPLPDRELVDGGIADVPGWRVRTIHMPGHTPGHTCFYLEERGKLLAGDHLLPTITPHIALYDHVAGDDDPLGDFLRSLDELWAIEMTEVLPAHEYRFGHPQRRALEIIEHHHTRLAQIEKSLQDGPLTLWQIAERMLWNRPWGEFGPFARRMALSEAAAHVHYLRRRRRIGLVNDDVPARYCLTN